MNAISFMGANLVAQQLNWSMTEGWFQGDTAANDFYRPLETFEERFDAFVVLTTEAGFSSLDVWTGQLNWAWATEAHLEAAGRVLRARNVSVTSYAGTFGETLDEFAKACAVAVALGAPILSGNTPLRETARTGVVEGLRSNDLVLAIENHPEASAEELLAKIGDGADGLIGAAIDTGWWGTNGANAGQCIRQLGSHVMHVHLKDIRAVGGHDTCELGDGIVDIEDCVAAIEEIGFTGPISIEHEPEHYDPVPEVVASLAKLKGWLAVPSAVS
ncbi:sugar phosphate isomerase/epimerase family protein [Microbacterium sp. DT81.1]|uniref:sugar phosphate isomerase/epimerase family protein n=1 Tax=Microbacterium sp. DT81.1 TaxID=3393413 RepID=UPI003CEAB00B